MNLLTQNSKLKKDGIWSFGLPPVKTCPYAGLCKSYCYARKGFYRAMPSVAKAQQARLARTKEPGFTLDMIQEIRRRRARYVRIHDSGDFYSYDYLNKWMYIALTLPEVQFYAYTKSMPYFRNRWYSIHAVKNLRLIFSQGGRLDHLIDMETMRHARIFETREDLLAAGYVDASESDMVAITTDSNKIGLIRH